ncbi:hypothetical protein ACSFA7_31580 [Variovorax sp. LT1R20]|uniref:hypothetical protein n=1 Tax=Variovorax sp. LT1R20 TaxID=3443729 RepID=UPI003F46AB42
MAGTISISAGAFFDLRTIDFEWVAKELRSRRTVENNSALSAVLQSHDEYGMDLLVADKLDVYDFRRFGEAFDSLTANLQSTSAGRDGLLTFLASVQAAIHNDSRWMLPDLIRKHPKLVAE